MGGHASVGTRALNSRIGSKWHFGAFVDDPDFGVFQHNRRIVYIQTKTLSDFDSEVGGRKLLTYNQRLWHASSNEKTSTLNGALAAPKTSRFKQSGIS
jgi:hypothetical protein